MTLATDLPIYKPTYDLILLVMNLTKNYPRSFRHGLARPRTHRAALARIAASAVDALPDTVTSYLGLFKHAGSRPQREQIARAAIHRGLWVEADLSKAKERR